MMIRLPKENIYGHTKKLKFIIEQIDKFIDAKQKDVVVLDFGCGNGSAVSQYLIRDKVQYYGVDTHGPSLEYARYHYQKENAFFLDSIPDGIRFDIIVYADVLEHLNDPVSVLRAHRCLLNDGGIVIGAVPNGFGPFEIEKKLDRWLGLSKLLEFAGRIKKTLSGSEHQRDFEIPYNIDSTHVQFFTRSSLYSTLKQGGFHITVFKKGAFLGAPFSEYFLRGEIISRINSRIADFLPYWADSTWYFVADKI